MKVTKKQIREYYGHNGQDCRVRITRNGEVLRYGSPDPFDRSKDYWQFICYIETAEKIVEDHIS